MAVILPAEIRMGSSIESDYLDIVGGETALAERDTETYVKTIPEFFDRLFVQFPLAPMPVEEINSAQIVMLLKTDVLIPDTGHGWVDVSLVNNSGNNYGLGKVPESNPGEYVEVTRLMLPADHIFLTEEWASEPGYGYHPSVRADPYTPDKWIAVYIAYLAIIINGGASRTLTIAPRRLTQRDDGLCGGAPRLTGKRSGQASNRLLGGYL